MRATIYGVMMAEAHAWQYLVSEEGGSLTPEEAHAFLTAQVRTATLIIICTVRPWPPPVSFALLWSRGADGAGAGVVREQLELRVGGPASRQMLAVVPNVDRFLIKAES